MSKKTITILTNILLFGAFILTHFLDLTGLAFHQYLGVAAGGLLIVHIITHAKWIEQVSARFFKKLSGKVRFYFLTDIILLVLIIAMILSGVLISTWLTINFEIYPLIRDLHIISSIAGLALLTIKLVFHWKYFANILKRIFPQIRAGKNTPAISSSSTLYTRRDAIITIGAVSAIGLFGLYKAVSALAPTKTQVTLPDPEVTIAQGGSTSEFSTSITGNDEGADESAHLPQSTGKQRRRGQGKALSSTDHPEVIIQPTSQTAQENRAIDIQPTMMPASPECVVRCARGCSFPGECGHYIDENKNSLCDLGECLVI